MDIRIPLIKIESRSYPDLCNHIVGTDSHDHLYVDPYSGGIQYATIQSWDTTQRLIDGEIDSEYGLNFCSEEGYFRETEIKIVSLEEYVDLLADEFGCSKSKKIALQQKIKELKNILQEIE